MSYYQDMIREDLADLGRPDASPVHVEAWVRAEHGGPLDALSRAELRASVRRGLAAADAAPKPTTRILAESYGLI